MVGAKIFLRGRHPLAGTDTDLVQVEGRGGGLDGGGAILYLIPPRSTILR